MNPHLDYALEDIDSRTKGQLRASAFAAGSFRLVNSRACGGF
jgi:hypothetical protein